MKCTLFQKQPVKFDILPKLLQPKIVIKIIERSTSITFFRNTNQFRTFENEGAKNFALLCRTKKFLIKIL